MKIIQPEESLIERLSWLIRLRWIAVIGVIGATFFAHHILKMPLPIFPLYTIAFILAVTNLIFFIMHAGIKEKKAQAVNCMANLQISLDLGFLTSLIHFSGGIENPFIFYFIFHMIIASILLSQRAAFLQATYAAVLLCLVAILEYTGVLPHYCLKGLMSQSLHNQFPYVIGVVCVFTSTLFIAVYMTTSISARLKERENNLKEAHKLLLENDRIKSEYVLRVTHDIKEHLAAIQSCIQPVTSGITGGLTDIQLNLLQRADERTAKLLFFIKALLEITRIKLTREIKMDYFFFKDAVSEVIASVTQKAQSKNIALYSSVEQSIEKMRGAKEYIQETIANILVNAIKYTPRNGEVNVTVTDKGSFIFIQIKDNGIGIPADELSKVFDEFYRASNARQVEREGTGLGLSIAKQVIERHNGRIWIDSEEGKGSLVSIELPK